jgi:hypothetical protein
MGAVTIKLNRAGVAQLLRDPKVLADIERRARAIATAAGPGHRVAAGIGATRARAVVITDTVDARRREATRRTLTRALDAGRR